MIWEDENEGCAHFLPPYKETESVIPIAGFVARKIIALNRSFLTATDNEERLELLEKILILSSTLSALTLAFYAESQELTDAAKEICRGLSEA